MWISLSKVGVFFYRSSFEAKKAALYALPESLRVTSEKNEYRDRFFISDVKAESSQRSEGMLSNQMLSGIPEVDLGIE